MTPSPAPIPTQREAARYFVRFIRLIRPFWGNMAGGIWLGFVVGLVGMITPYLTKALIDQAYPQRDIGLMRLLVLGVMTIAVSSAVMGVIRSYYAQVIGARLSRSLALMFLNHMQHLPVRFFDEHRVGELLSRFGDLQGVAGKVSGVFQTLFVSGAYVVLVPPFLFILNWKLALLSLLSLPFTTVISLTAGRMIRKYSKQSMEANASLSAFRMEALSHIRVLKGMAAEHYVYARARDLLEESLRAQMKGAAYGSVFGLCSSMVRMASTAVYSWYAWTLILHDELSLGAFIAFSAYLGYLTGPVGQFTGLFVGFQQTAVLFGRAFEYLDVPTEQDPSLAFTPPPPVQRRAAGDIVFDGVHFGYTRDKEVLSNCSFRINAGGVSAIVGASGCGKSTLLRLLCNMAQPTGGTISIGGAPLNSFSLPDLRRQLSVVWQDVSLMRGSVWDNLTLGLSHVEQAVVERAVALCRLDGFVAELPEGYQTPIAEWGANISGGQRQRMALARALIRDTPVLLLDEATSQIDIETEQSILADLFAGNRATTIIMVTHRSRSAAMADYIYAVESAVVRQMPHERFEDTMESERRVGRSIAGAYGALGIAYTTQP